MSGKKSLYDLLEVSNSASVEAIRASFDRVTAKFDSGTLISPAGLDAQAYYNLVKDAYFTLGNAAKREAYDKRLSSIPIPATSTDYYEEVSGVSGITKIVLFVLVIGAAFYAFKIHRDGEVETARLLAEAQKAELEKTEKQKEVETLALERQDQSIETQQAAQRRAEMERARSEGDQNSRQLQRNQEQVKREEERQRQDNERRMQSDARQQQYRADVERQRLISAAQQRDYSRPKAAAIENRPDKLSPNR